MVYSYGAPSLAEGDYWSVWELRAMRARLILKPGQRRTQKLYTEYGERLLCVRYRCDEERRKRSRRWSWSLTRSIESHERAAAAIRRVGNGSCATTKWRRLAWRTESSESSANGLKSIYQ